MPNIFKLLIPKFLKRLDTWLLERYPFVWQTHAHYLFFYSLSIAPILFIIGFFYPTSPNDIAIDPIKPIVLSSDMFFILTLYVLAILLLIIFGDSNKKIIFNTYKQVLLVLSIQSTCLWVILSITAPAFRLGNLVRSAFFLIDDVDIEYWEKNDHFLYGYKLKETDSSYINPSDIFFQQREHLLKEKYYEKKKILSYRYDENGIDSIVKKIPQSFYKNTNDPSGKYSYRSGLFDGFDIINRWYKLYRNDRIDTLDRLCRFYRVKYSKYYQENRTLAFMSYLDKYNIVVEYDSIYLLREYAKINPYRIYKMSDAIFAIKNARQFLQNDIILLHWKSMLYYLPFITLLLFCYTNISANYIFLPLPIVFLVKWLFYYFELDISSINSFCVNFLIYLFFPIIALVILTISRYKNIFNKYISISFYVLIFGIEMVFFNAILMNGFFSTSKFSMVVPMTEIFWVVQIIGMIGILQMSYLQTIPKPN